MSRKKTSGMDVLIVTCAVLAFVLSLVKLASAEPWNGPNPDRNLVYYFAMSEELKNSPLLSPSGVKAPQVESGFTFLMDGKEAFSIHPDGTIDMYMKPDAAAKVFWDAVMKQGIEICGKNIGGLK